MLSTTVPYGHVFYLAIWLILLSGLASIQFNAYKRYRNRNWLFLSISTLCSILGLFAATRFFGSVSASIGTFLLLVCCCAQMVLMYSGTLGLRHQFGCPSGVTASSRSNAALGTDTPFRFNIRDVLWLTMLIAVSLAWFLDRAQMARNIDAADIRLRDEQSKPRLLYVGNSTHPMKPGQKMLIHVKENGSISVRPIYDEKVEQQSK